MISISYEQTGEPAIVLRPKEISIPRPNATEVLVRIRHSPITPSDLATIRGVYRTPQTTPTVPGYNGIGEVVEVGADVTSFRIGAKVLILPFKKSGWTNGCWQEFVCAEQSDLIAMADGLGFDDVPDFFTTSMTAWVIVVNCLNLSPGQKVLVTAAGSCVGRSIIRLAKVRGYSVIAVVRRAEQVAQIKELGVEQVICSSTEDIGKTAMQMTNLKGVDAVIDSVGGDVSSQCFKVLADWGKMVVFGLLDKERNSSLDIRKMLFYNLRIEGFWLPGWWFHSDMKTRMHAINRTMEFIKDGTLTLPIEKRYKFSQIAEAVQHAERPGNTGRILLEP